MINISSEKMGKLISIITPSYNQANYIKDTISSVRNQSYRPLEHIIIDGGSTDETIDILKAYELDSNNIQVTWISEMDRGQAHAINKGLKLARGDIIGWINSDDVYFLNDVFARVVKAFVENPEVDIIHGDVAKIGENNLINFIWCIPEFNYERMCVDGKISQPTVFFRCKVFKDHALRENFLAVDYELWLRLGRSYRFKHLNLIIAGDREQPNRISARKKEELLNSHIQARDEYFPNPSSLKIFWFQSSSFILRSFFRVRGLIKFILLTYDPRWIEKLAFNGFIDNNIRVFYRQIFQRIGK
jgi:glycosyltransferase involved in cell wall biosynthesis